MSVRKTLSLAPAAAAGIALALSGAAAQEKFPSKPIEVVTHSGVGGGTDITARMMMVQAPATCGQELVVVNKTGGSGAAALSYAASRPKDGHTILLITQTHLLSAIQGRGGGVGLDDIVGVARATDDPQVLMVGKDSPYKSAKEFLDASKSKSMKYGTTHIGSVDHIAVLGFAKAAGVQQPTVVPFRGGGDIVTNLVGGNLDAALVNYTEAESQIKAGEIRALLVLDDQRSPSLPDVPTGAEAGVPVEYSTVRGFAVIKGVPEDRLKTLEDCLIKAMNGKFFQDYLKTSGQALNSVVGSKEWQKQINDFVQTGKEALAAIGATK